MRKYAIRFIIWGFIGLGFALLSLLVYTEFGKGIALTLRVISFNGFLVSEGIMFHSYKKLVKNGLRDTAIRDVLKMR